MLRLSYMLSSTLLTGEYDDYKELQKMMFPFKKIWGYYFILLGFLTLIGMGLVTGLIESIFG